MSERDELVEYLRICGACHGGGIGADGDTCANCGDQRQPNRRAASLLERDGARIAELEAEAANLRTVMVAAAEEIHEHWSAHCDADGYGPTNLMTRLERGIAAQYRYSAGDFARLYACLADLDAKRNEALARAEAAAREAVAAWMIEHAFATGHGDTLTDLLAELSWQIAEIKRDAIKWRDTPIPVPPGECPYPIHADRSIEACVAAGDCGCGQNKT